MSPIIPAVNFLSLIEAKRDGETLTAAQIQSAMAAYVAGNVPDYQMSAFLMAVYFRSLDTAETTALTLAMRDSGDVLRFPVDPRPLVDKHSTGGVGDKVSLPLSPLLASLGFRVPMISGRGLGITGGTLDKMESIPGFSTRMEAAQIIEAVQTVGCVMCGQTDLMVPADKGLYALRDVTGTVPSIPLITASILSKKLAENLQALVLDVKFGAAAFMPTREQATKLARSMVDLGNQCGVNTRALLTNMDRPLGAAVGNWLEVKESVECLAGAGPQDLRELVIELAAHLQVQTGRVGELAQGRSLAQECLDSGRPRKRWEEMLSYQGANLKAFRRKLEQDTTAPVVVELKSMTAGFLNQCNARVLGEVVRDLGGGRLTKESVINPDVGLDRIVPLGTAVAEGDLLCRIHAATAEAAEAARVRLAEAFGISAVLEAPSPLLDSVCVAQEP